MFAPKISRAACGDGVGLTRGCARGLASALSSLMSLFTANEGVSTFAEHPGRMPTYVIALMFD